MRKTSVYLDEERQNRLSRASQATGRSQAELIRSGVDLVTAQALDQRPAMRARCADGQIVDRIDELMSGFDR